MILSFVQFYISFLPAFVFMCVLMLTQWNSPFVWLNLNEIPYVYWKCLVCLFFFVLLWFSSDHFFLRCNLVRKSYDFFIFFNLCIPIVFFPFAVVPFTLYVLHCSEHACERYTIYFRTPVVNFKIFASYQNNWFCKVPFLWSLLFSLYKL